MSLPSCRIGILRRLLTMCTLLLLYNNFLPRGLASCHHPPLACFSSHTSATSPPSYVSRADHAAQLDCPPCLQTRRMFRLRIFMMQQNFQVVTFIESDQVAAEALRIPEVKTQNQCQPLSPCSTHDLPNTETRTHCRLALCLPLRLW